MTGIVKILIPTEVQAAQTQANQIGTSSSLAIAPNKFGFFAAFDGTNNTRDNPDYSNDKQSIYQCRTDVGGNTKMALPQVATLKAVITLAPVPQVQLLVRPGSLNTR